MDRAAVLGRKFNLSTAFEWALKLQEMSGVLAQPFSAADFEHGPIAVVEPGFAVFVVLPPGPIHEDMKRLALRLRDERGVRLILMSGLGDRFDHSDAMITLPGDVPEWLSPAPAIVGGQLFSYHLAVAKQLDPDSPRHLSKVTRTR
jgi:glucosamine--fructose-6-phosphate aminotransferase (isomerizing)